MRGVTGASSALLHAASLAILSEPLTYEVLAIGDETILGRDVLNRYIVTLDGPLLRARIALPTKRRS